MARGFVKKRGDTWYAYWRTASGRQRSKAVSRRKKDAEAYLNQVQSELGNGTYREIKSATFDKFAARWLDDYAEVHLKPSTLKNYRCIVDGSLVPTFGERILTAIETEDVQHLVATLSKTRQPATVRKHLMVLKLLLGHAVTWGYLKHNPAQPVKPPALPHKEMDFLTAEEVRLFLPQVEDSYRPLFLTAVMTGMRLGELIALQWGDIDWTSRTLRVQRSAWNGQFQEPKSKRSVRVIGLTATVLDALLRHKMLAPANEHDLVFTTAEGLMLDPSNVRNRVFEPALRRAGLRKIRIHDLRHTFASLLINQGENIKYVQQQLGHSTIQLTVDQYGHLLPDAHIGASARLDQTVFGATIDDKPLTSASEMKQAESWLSSRPAVLLVGDEGFEPPTVTL